MDFHPTVQSLENAHAETAVQVAAALGRAGLRLPVLIALDASRPLTFLGAQCLYIAQPVLNLFFPHPVIRQLAYLLEQPHGVEMLIQRLETNDDSP
ncbi:MAG: hypothetical protein KA314_03125 [Chloroflexi bacterium]|nr:hypothetical protein [Chloroflexota bacterium]MBP8054803.1 hypothetical protein [Chloroflexota bacterium]